ncbi:fanconi-associated nuclease 1 [Hordeum vulgare]|nr:fanconi-associated nuclease 1 [Hordeum vulgare]
MGEAEGEAAAVAPSLSGGSVGSEWVACPVCREFIPGSDDCINTHQFPRISGTLTSLNVENDDAVEKASSFSLSGGRTYVGTDASPNAYSSTTLAVKTVIVGQRFHENFKLQEGMSITILKDPQNAKEPDAVKVLYAGSDCGQMLGYVPQLAKVLAPLLDTHFIQCEEQETFVATQAGGTQGLFVWAMAGWLWLWLWL